MERASNMAALAHFPTAVFSLICAFAALVLYKGIYNLYFHPLRKFPGSKLAIISSAYEFWFDVVKDGTYLWEMEKMHDKYGPVIRVNPSELHIRDSHYYGDIYVSGHRKVNKETRNVRAYSVATSAMATIEHHHHRVRRGYISNYFSRRSILAMEADIHHRITKLCAGLDNARENKSTVALNKAIGALAADIITHRLYGQDFNYLEAPGYDNPMLRASVGNVSNFNISRFVPGLFVLVSKLPMSVIKVLSPHAASLISFLGQMKLKMLHELAQGEKSHNKSLILSTLNDHDIPPSGRHIDRILEEGLAILFAGADTVTRALSVGFFYLLDDQTHIGKLRCELASMSDEPSSWSITQLEKLPYLNGVVYEALRLSFGVPCRLPRIAVEEALQYKDYTIPPGTPVSQSTYFVHTDANIYPNPFLFDPERWIQAAKDSFPLQRYLVSFTKGSRQCVASQLAIAEMHLVIARLVAAFDMELHNTTVDDVRLAHVRMLPFPAKTSTNCGKEAGEISVKITGRIHS